MSTSVYAGGLGERLVSNSIEAATTSFNSLPIIDLSNLSGSSGDRIQLAAEIQDVGIYLIRFKLELSKYQREERY